MSETDLVRAIIGALQLKGIWCWRVNSGVTVLGSGKSKRVIKGAPAGSPDIEGIFPPGSGRFFGLEVKTETGRVLASQQRWHEKARGQGVRVAVVRSVAEALEAVRGWSGGSNGK